MHLHCRSASNRSPGSRPSASWSNLNSDFPLSSKHLDWLVSRNMSKYFRLHGDHVIFPLPSVGLIMWEVGSQSLSAWGPSKGDEKKVKILIFRWPPETEGGYVFTKNMHLIFTEKLPKYFRNIYKTNIKIRFPKNLYLVFTKKRQNISEIFPRYVRKNHKDKNCFWKIWIYEFSPLDF